MVEVLLPFFKGQQVLTWAAYIHLSLSLSTIELEEGSTLYLLNLPSILH